MSGFDEYSRTVRAQSWKKWATLADLIPESGAHRVVAIQRVGRGHRLLRRVTPLVSHGQNSQALRGWRRLAEDRDRSVRDAVSSHQLVLASGSPQSRDFCYIFPKASLPSHIIMYEVLFRPTGSDVFFILFSNSGRGNVLALSFFHHFD